MQYDVMIIGAGPGGYVAAERAGQAGLKALLVEREALGGVCLNWGCIPTKALLASAKRFYEATHSDAFGLEVESAVFRLERAMQRKAEVQDKLRKGIAGLMKKFKVDVVTGDAVIQSPGKLQVGDEVYEGRHILIATGSRPAKPPIPGADLPHVVDSTGLLQISALPKQMAIIGGGVIGLEFACFFASIGIPVTVIEMLPEVGGAMDADLAAMLRQDLGKKGVTFALNCRVSGIDENSVSYQTADGQEQSVTADLVLLSTGRQPNIENIGLDAVGVDHDRRGIVIDDDCRTNVPGIWAAGDVTGRIQLAHVASRQAEVVINQIAGQSDHMRYEAVPAVIYTSPEVAWCGMTQQQAEDAGIPTKLAQWPFSANGRFLADSDGRGMAKVVVHAETRQILGVHLLGHSCSEMIHSAASMIETEQRIDELRELVFPHPTVSETMRDAVFHF